jgi:hypothetical protein
MPFPARSRLLAASLGLLAAGGLGLADVAVAQGTPGVVEFRWENDRNYRKLYFWQSDTVRLKRSEYYLMLRPKDRKTAILKLSISVPANFESEIEAKDLKLCKMRQGGITKRTRCLEEIPAAIELADNGRTINVFPETPVPEDETIGLYMRLFNPFSAGMYQFNALAQAPGEIPVSGYLGSWLIQIDPN